MERGIKKSFVLYVDNIQQIELLTNDEAGRLLKRIYRYVDTGRDEDSGIRLLDVLFAGIKAQLDRDAAKYKAKCETNSRIAREREENRRNKNTNVHERARTSTNVTDNDSDNDNDNDSDNDNESDISISADTDTTHAPTLQEVYDYIKPYGYDIDDARDFYCYYDAVGWVTGTGRPVKRWKSCAVRFLTKKRILERNERL